MNASFLLRGLLVVAALPPGIAFAQKFPDVRIDSGTDPSLWAHDPQIAAVGSSVFVAWWDEQSGIGFNRSLDGGMTWLDTALTPPGGEHPSQLALEGALGGHTRSIAVSGSNVYLIWFKDVDGSGDAPIHFNRSLDGGSTWLPDAVLVDSGGDPDNWLHRICAAGSSVYVAWTDHRDGHSNVYFDRSLDGGTTWLPADVRLDVGSTSSRFVDMAASGSAVHVTWVAYASGVGDIYYTRSLDGGTTWLPAPVRLDLGTAPSAAASGSPRIAVSGSSVYVAWLDARDGWGVYFNASMDAGATWLPTDLSLDGTPGFEGPWNLRIAASGSAVYATWQERTWHESPWGPYPLWDIELNRSLDGGMTWLPFEVRLDQHLGDDVYPEIAAWASSVDVTWYSTNGRPDIFLNRSVDWGTTWLPQEVRIDVSSPPGQDVSLYPRVAASGSSVYVAWEERVGEVGDQGIHFNLASGYQTYGGGLAGAGGLVPTIFGGGGPSIGGTMALFLANGRGAAPGVLLYGLAGQASIPFLGGRLHVAPPFSRVPVMLGGAPGQPGAGAAALMLSIPNDVALLGLRLDFQAGFFDHAALHGVSLTGGLEAWVL